jgi:hypothetical protein
MTMAIYLDIQRLTRARAAPAALARSARGC